MYDSQKKKSSIVFFSFAVAAFPVVEHRSNSIVPASNYDDVDLRRKKERIKSIAMHCYLQAHKCV